VDLNQKGMAALAGVFRIGVIRFKAQQAVPQRGLDAMAHQDLPGIDMELRPESYYW
jgi:hypothetical protein